VQLNSTTYAIFGTIVVAGGCLAAFLDALTMFALVVLPLVFLLSWFAFFRSATGADAGLGAGQAKPDGAAKGSEPGRLPAGFGQTLLNQMPAPLLLINEAGRLVFANPAAEELLPSCQVGLPYTTQIRTPSFIEAITKTFATGVESEVSFSTPHPRERFLEARASRLPPGSGMGNMAVVIVQLEDRTQDRLIMQTRSDFVANASHELRTPLASILGFIETLQGHAKDDPEAHERFLAIMHAQASRMKRLVNDLMSLSRIEMTAHVVPEEQIAINSVAREAASALLPLAKQSDVTLSIDLPPDDEPIHLIADRDQIAQVIVNLVENAIKYSGEGKTVRLFVAEPDPSYPGQFGLTVSDNGQGIARQHLPRLTERFYRVNNTQTTDQSGTGLGLAITKHILNRHGGALDIQSTHGNGSRFTIWLPEVKNPESDTQTYPAAAE